MVGFTYAQFHVEMDVLIFGCISDFWRVDSWDADFEVSMPFRLVNNQLSVFNFSKQQTKVAIYLTEAIQYGIDNVVFGTGLSCDFEALRDEFHALVSGYLRNINNRKNWWGDNDGAAITWRVNQPTITIPNYPIMSFELTRNKDDLNCSGPDVIIP